MSGFRAPVDLKRLHVYRQGTSAGSVYIAGNFSKELAADPAVDPCTEYVGAYVPEKTCVTCRYWDNSYSVEGRGYCRAIRYDDGKGSTGDAVLHEYGSVDCAATFGCVLHEEKE